MSAENESVAGDYVRLSLAQLSLIIDLLQAQDDLLATLVSEFIQFRQEDS